jgi:hypothetical protein
MIPPGQLARGFSFAAACALIPTWTRTLRTSSGRLLGMPWQPVWSRATQVWGGEIMNRVPKIIGLLCLLIWMSACSSSGSIQIMKQKTVSIPPGKTVSLSVTAALPDNADNDAREDASEVTHRLKSHLFGRLVSEAVFKQVLQPGEQANYRMDVKVLNAEEVSQGARIFFGVLAGSNKLTVSVSLYDQPADDLITAIEAGGESASHPLSAENDIDDAIREVVDEIILALR